MDGTACRIGDNGVLTAATDVPAAVLSTSCGLTFVKVRVKAGVVETIVVLGEVWTIWAIFCPPMVSVPPAAEVTFKREGEEVPVKGRAKRDWPVKRDVVPCEDWRARTAEDGDGVVVVDWTGMTGKLLTSGLALIIVVVAIDCAANNGALTTCCPARLTSCCEANPPVQVVAVRTGVPGIRPVVFIMRGLLGEVVATPRMLLAGRAWTPATPERVTVVPPAIWAGTIRRVWAAGVKTAPWVVDGVDTIRVGCWGLKVMVGRTKVCCCEATAGWTLVLLLVAATVTVADWLGMVINCNRPSGNRIICWPGDSNVENYNEAGTAFKTFNFLNLYKLCPVCC